MLQFYYCKCVINYTWAIYEEVVEWKNGEVWLSDSKGQEGLECCNSYSFRVCSQVGFGHRICVGFYIQIRLQFDFIG